MPVEADLTVRGTVSAPADATVYGVQVAGIDATNAGTDFDTWTATIPIGVLVKQSSGSKNVTVKATATTNCGPAPIVLDSLPLVIDPTPVLQVTSLTATLVYPGQLTYLPSTRPASLIVQLTANPQAAGVAATLTTNLGTIAPDRVVLAGDRVANATASALFSSTQAGVAQIVASTGQVAGVAPLVKIVGPPTLMPDGASLTPGATLPIEVFDDGKFESCQATPAIGLHVTSGAQDLMARPGGADQTQDGVVDLTLTVDATLAARSTTVISCRDAYGQTTTGTFVASP